MKEQLVDIKVAKLAKKKGFKIPTWDYFSSYDNDGLPNLIETCDTSRQDWNNWKHAYLRNRKEKLYSRPTQSLLQKWLRDIHDIKLEINYSDCEWWTWVIITDDVHMSGTNKKDDVDLTYEEALEAGLQEALKLI